MKIKKDWFGMFSSTREYARSIYVREPTEEVEKRIWTKRIKTAGVLMAALLLSFLYCLFQPSDTQEILDGYVVRRQEQEQSLAVTAESNDGLAEGVRTCCVRPRFYGEGEGKSGWQDKEVSGV